MPGAATAELTPALREAIGDHLDDGNPVAMWDRFVTELRYASYTVHVAPTESPTPVRSLGAEMARPDF